ncbi:helix-turn-helix domain-containing protein [Halostagnicola sp. A-GB9-2]|uniref:helix-turn-helix domain-containing protein n=1 Tax=Halostagnicola sp. A-GB9-2 TaxID=3048066 RepID=UPI0024BFB4DB|nr:helix-turn-helix domain-containing protein [Halostagnicola sp. A-GB9-2]MDJ1434208.1 helix-turn-helix domain-containing protein [Halostagnicola sp. A-GB9-2]
MWCNEHCDLLHIKEMADSDVSLVALRDSAGIDDIIRTDNEMILITEECLLGHEENLLEGYLERHNCLSFPPREYRNGTITIRIISLNEENLTTFFHDINEDYSVTVESKQEIANLRSNDPLLMIDADVPNLSERQQEALLTAFDMGYYEIPRRHTTADIADEMGIQRRTFEEHLRRSEEKLLNSLVDHIRRA